MALQAAMARRIGRMFRRFRGRMCTQQGREAAAGRLRLERPVRRGMVRGMMDAPNLMHVPTPRSATAKILS